MWRYWFNRDTKLNSKWKLRALAWLWKLRLKCEIRSDSWEKIHKLNLQVSVRMLSPSSFFSVSLSKVLSISMENRLWIKVVCLPLARRWHYSHSWVSLDSLVITPADIWNVFILFNRKKSTNFLHSYNSYQKESEILFFCLFIEWKLRTTTTLDMK